MAAPKNINKSHSQLVSAHSPNLLIQDFIWEGGGGGGGNLGMVPPKQKGSPQNKIMEA